MENRSAWLAAKRNEIERYVRLIARKLNYKLEDMRWDCKWLSFRMKDSGRVIAVVVLPPSHMKQETAKLKYFILCDILEAIEAQRSSDYE